MRVGGRPMSPTSMAPLETNAATAARIQFYTQSFTIFTSLQSIAAAQEDEVQTNEQAWLHAGPSVQTMQYYHRVGSLYSDTIHTYVQALEAIDTTESDYERHVQELHMIFHLAQVLYVPEDGSGMGVVGEELLHWLNAHDVAPTTEQGQQIAETIPPHDHAEYWDYLFRCVLRGFFSTAATVLQSYMTQTRSATLQSITSDTIQILQTVPRSTVFTTEQAFFAAHRHWHTSVRVFLSGIQRQMDAVESELQDASASPSDERLELEAQFRCLLELLCGVQERILEFSEDWKEALCAWGILVQPAIKRDDVPDVAQTIMETLPVDGTLPSESIMASFFRGDITKGIKLCASYDEWLAAHLGDYFDKAQLLTAPDEIPSSSSPSPTLTPLLLAWAETLLREERLWRMALSYLHVIGTPEARSKMRSILFDVPLLDPPSEPMSEDQAAEEQFHKVEEVLSACIEYGMDDEVRLVCQRVGHALMEQQKYGLAIAYSVRARDARQIRTIADHMLRVYVEQGPAAFIASVDTVPRVLLETAESLGDDDTDSAQAPLPTPFATTSSIFSAQTFAPLVFHFKYCDFHKLFANEATWHEAAHVLVGLLTSDITPESFLSVLLVDALPFIQASDLYFTMAETYELLRITEKVSAGSDMHENPQAADFYFHWLEQLLAHTDEGKESQFTRRKLAQERMMVVRLALTQYLSRALVEAGPTPLVL